MLKAHTAEPLIELTGVENTPYTSWFEAPPYWPSTMSLVDSANMGPH